MNDYIDKIFKFCYRISNLPNIEKEFYKSNFIRDCLNQDLDTIRLELAQSPYYGSLGYYIKDTESEIYNYYHECLIIDIAECLKQIEDFPKVHSERVRNAMKYCSNLTNKEYYQLYGELSEERILDLLAKENELNNYECDCECDECYGLERSIDDIYYIIQEFDEKELFKLQSIVMEAVDNNPDLDESLISQTNKVIDLVTSLLQEIKLSI